MQTVLFLILGSVFLGFGLVVFFGAPYVPVLSAQKFHALELLSLKPGDTLLELGCGDGRMVAAAAASGLRVVGYELNPFLALYAWLRTRKYRKNVTIIWGNYWTKPWPKVEGIYVFLLDKYMKKLDNKIMQTYAPGRVRLVSFAFKVPGKKPVKSSRGLFLYQY